MLLLLAAQFPGQSHGEVLEGGRDKLGRRFRLAGGPGLALPGLVCRVRVLLKFYEGRDILDGTVDNCRCPG